MKKIWVVFMVVILTFLPFCLSMAEIAFPIPYEGAGWETPEAAVTNYVNGLNEMDLPLMLSSFAIETHVNHYDLRSSVELKHMFSFFDTSINYLGDNDFLWNLDVLSRLQSISQSIQWQLHRLVFPKFHLLSGSSTMITFSRQSTYTQEQFFIDLETACQEFDLYHNVELAQFYDITTMHGRAPGEVAGSSIAEEYAGESAQKDIAVLLARTGADEYKCIIAEINVGEQPYLLFCDAVLYGDLWFIDSLGGLCGRFFNLSSVSGGIATFSAFGNLY